MPTLTVYSDTNDGGINAYDHDTSNYSIAREGSGNKSVSTASTSIQVGQGFYDDGGNLLYDVYQYFIDFDTSSIDDTDTVDSVILSLYGFISYAYTAFTMEAREHGWSPTLDTGDFVAGSSLSGKTLLASLGSGSFSSSSYMDFTSQAAFLTATNMKTGTVSIIVASNRQKDGNTPTQDENVYIKQADEAGTTKDPKLVVVSTTVASGRQMNVVKKQAVNRAATW